MCGPNSEVTAPSESEIRQTVGKLQYYFLFVMLPRNSGAAAAGGEGGEALLLRQQHPLHQPDT